MEQDVLDISITTEGDVTVLRLRGELDALNVSDLTQAFERLLDEGRRMFVLDLQDLEFIDSAGLGGLVRMWENSVERGSFTALGQPSERVREVLQITGLHSVLKAYQTREDAMQAVRDMMEAFPSRSEMGSQPA